MSEERLEAIKVELEGPVASFRYPHFLIGRQPTYPMPPPSTIYGLISAALGYFPDPHALRFAYRFECARQRVDDVETIWFVQPNTATRGEAAKKNLEAQSNILPREWLVHPRLTLYVTGHGLEALYQAFRSPSYILTLGRSQELVSVRRVERVALRPAQKGWLTPGLFPVHFREWAPLAPAIHMPRFITPRSRRQVEWDWFLALDAPVRLTTAVPELCWAELSDLSEPHLLYFHAFRTSS
ncbi:CRISPR-associated protein Cas5 [Rhodothermus profundi]|uniref:CRISPR-associated protein, Cas5t family n=1 Tax=Rhodothermus profundi TaxID=633813 RepID=A0A1M6V500_9BACT|nr:CRISPR-associated protein Cas5 [Rhodothermus profundi]SHK76523.1 CRISPR-associated protein, Cas5t family [Rhodothermus profundi]